MFILPWGDLSYIGTTDTETEESPDRLDILPDEVVYLLRSANARFPNARLTVDDVRAPGPASARWWLGLAAGGQQPLARPPGGPGLGGVITVAGGKLTTYRVMAREVVDRAIRELRLREGGAARARRSPMRSRCPGARPTTSGRFASGGWSWGCARQRGPPGAALRDRGGGNLQPRRRRPSPPAPAAAAAPAIEAEVLHAVRRELAQTVEDVLVRRLHLYYEHPERGVPAAYRVAELMAREHAWDERRVAAEAERYEAFARR